jgi:TolA-binding protein
MLLGVLAVADHSVATPALTRYGMQYEAARTAAAAGDRATAIALGKALAAEDQGTLAAGRKDALALLRGSLHFTAGEWDLAADAFGRAARASDDADLEAAAAYRRAEARAAGLGGRDNEAEAVLWHQWQTAYPTSSLQSEAALRLVWIDLREGRIARADAALAELSRREAWLTGTVDFRFVQATRAFLKGDYAASLALVDGNSDGPAPLYLAALCHQELDQPLQAAAGFQQVTVRFPGSALHDHALFAKANTFLNARMYRSADEEFTRVADTVHDPLVRAEAELRRAAAVHLAGDHERAASLLRQVVIVHEGGDVAARGQFLLGEVMVATGDYRAAIVEYTRVLTSYFDKSIAASAQYRLGRCYAAMNQPGDAIASYMAVVAGYPLEPEAPAAAYMAGKALLEADDARGAVPYFQIVLDRYARQEGSDGTIVFARPGHQDLVEASLCMLAVAWHRIGDLGQLTGAPHALLQQAPPSQSFWRAWTILIDADAMASQGNLAEARASLELLKRDFPRHPAVTAASQLLAWTYAQQGEEERAIAESEDMLARYTGQGDLRPFSQALLNVAHVRFNQSRYQESVAAYEEYLSRYGDDSHRLPALYQAGLCYLRLDRGGDAIDRWETLVRTAPGDAMAEKAWARAGDLYFQAEHYDQAKRCYEGLLANFSGTSAAGLGLLRIAQCDFNAGRDAAAVAGYEELIRRQPDSLLRPEADRGLEMALFRMGQQPDGIGELGQLLVKYPQGSFAPDAQFQIATRLYEAGDFTAAAREYRRVVSLYPGYGAADRAQFLYAESYERAADAVQARLAYEQFLALFPASELRVAAQFRVAMSHFNSESYAPAAAGFAGVLAGQPEPDLARAALFNLGLCSRLLGDLEQAVGHFQRYQTTYPRDERLAEVAFQLGDTHDQAGRVTEAIASFRAAARAKPAANLHAEIYFRMGSCFEKLDNRKKALEAYGLAARGAAEDDPFRLSAVARCAVLYEDAGRFDEALASYRDLMDNARDAALVTAASGRAREIAAAMH